MSIKVVDLSELGEEFKGYAPKAEKGQTEKEFEKEELQDHVHSAPSLTLAKFKGTRYYKEVFNKEDLSNEKDKMTKSTNEEENGGESNPGKPGSDNVEEEKERAVGGAPLPDSSSFEEKALPQTVPVAPKVEAINESIAPTLSVPFESVGADAQPVFVQSRPSVVRQYLTPVDDNPYFMFEDSINAFDDPLSARDAQMLKAEDIVSRYGGILRNVETELDPIFRDRKIPKSGTLGVNLHEMITSLPAELYNNSIATVHEITRTRIAGSRTDEAFSYIGSVEEKDLIDELQAIEHINLRDVKDKWNFIRYLDDEEISLVPLPTDLDPEFTKIWHHPPTHVLGYMQDRSATLSKIMSDMLASLIRTHVVVPARSETQTMVDLLNTLNVRVGRFSQINSFPSSLSGGAGSEFFRALLHATVNSRYDRLWFDFSFETLNLEQLLLAVTLKLFAPKQAVHPDTIIDCDNYILKYLAPALPNLSGESASFLGAEDIPFSEDFIKRDKNYLTEASEHNSFGGPIGKAFELLFVTTEAGGGWGSTEEFERVPFPSGAKDWVQPGRDSMYYPMGGKRPMSDSSVPLQFNRFDSFIRAMSTKTFKFQEADRDLGRALITLMSRLSQFRSRFASFNFYAHKVLKRFALSSFVHPTAPNEGMITLEDGTPIPINPIPVSVTGPVSALFLVEWENVKPLEIDIRYLEMGWTINHYFHELAVRYHYVVEHFKHPVHSKTDKVREVFTRNTANLSFSPVLMENLGSVPTLYDFFDDIFPPIETIDYSNAPYVRSMTVALGYVENFPLRFGYARRFYYGRLSQNPHPNEHQRAWIARGDEEENILRVVTYEEWVDMMQSEELSDLIASAKLSEKLICFDFPIAVRVTEITDQLTCQTAPITFASRGERATVGTIDFFYEWAEKFRREGTNDLALTEDPVWLIDESPFVMDADAKYGELIHTIIGKRDGYTIFKDFTFMPRYRTS
jgi:hypothetical protein